MGFFSKIINTLKEITKSELIINTKTKQTQILLPQLNEEYFTLEFESLNCKNYTDVLVEEYSYLKAENAKLGKIYMEAIQLGFGVQWENAPFKSFELMLEKNTQGLDLQQIEMRENYFSSLALYQLNNMKKIGLIYFSLNQYEVFIVDTKGKLFDDIAQILQMEFEPFYEQEQLEIEYDFTLFNTNFTEQHYQKEN